MKEPKHDRNAPGAPDPLDLESESEAPLADVRTEDSKGSSGDADEPASVYKDRWLRAEAEFQNYRRRAQRERDEAQRYTEQRYLLEVVSLLDDLERALEVTSESGAPESWVGGVRLVAQRMSDFLAREGVTKIEALGKPFDPEFHEALMEVEATDTRPGDVAQVLRAGYQRNGRALRAVRVAVAKETADAGHGEASDV